MNLHPVFVHFPIALLTIYALLELIRWRVVLERSYVFYVKAVLVILGAASAWVARQTGLLIRDTFRAGSTTKLVDMHETWATGSAILFTVLALAYLIAWLEREWVIRNKILLTFRRVILNTPLVWILALSGLIGITVTGALGGAIAYGPNIDPVAGWVYHILIR